MALSEAQISAVADEANRLFAAGTRRVDIEKTLKTAFTDFRVTLCGEDDVIVKPFRDEAAYELHLVGGGGHCLSLIRDPEGAVGVVLAVKE